MNSISESISKLARSALIIFLGTVVSRLLGLFGEIIIVRSLPPHVYGHIALAYTIIALISQISLVGLRDSVVRFLSSTEKTYKKHDIIRSGYTLSLVISVIICIFLYETRAIISGVFNNKELVMLLPLLLPYLIFHPIAKVSFAILQSEGKSIEALISRHLVPRTIGVFLLITMIALQQATYGAVLFWISFPLFTLILSLYYIDNIVGLKKVLDGFPSLSQMKALLSFSWPLATGSIILLLLARTDILMIGYFLNSKQVGIYRSVQPLRQIVDISLVAFSFIFFPLATKYFENNKINRLETIYVSSAKWASIIIFPILLTIILFSKEIILILFTPDYIRAAPVISILLSGLFFRTLVGLNGDLIRAIDRPKVELISSIFGFISNLLLNLLLIPNFGIIGAAIGTVVGFGIYNLTEVIYIWIILDIHPFSRNTIIPLIVTSGVATCTWFLFNEHQFGIGGIVVISGVFYFVQLVSIFATYSVDDEDIYLLTEVENKMNREFRFIRTLLQKYNKQ
ncbi:MAG: flippase [Candidatus Paceibacteria bacterium]